MEFSTETLKPIAEQFATIITQALEQEPEQLIRNLETDMRKSLQEIGRQALGQVLSQEDKAAEKTQPCECGGELQYQRHREAKVLSVFGWINYRRSYYAGCSCRKGQAPLDQRFGLKPGQVTAGLAELLALSGVELGFEHSGRFLERFLLFRVSENTVRKETECFGRLQDEHEAQEKEQYQNGEYLQERLRQTEAPVGRVYGAMDGAHVRIEQRRKKGETGQKDDNKEKWQEMKVGCWYEVEAVPPAQQQQRHRKKVAVGEQPLRTRNLAYFCEIEAAEKFGKLLWARGCQRQADLAAEVVFVCDGAHWIWRLVDHYYPQATQIVDWHHAQERLEKVAKEAFSGQAAATWLEEVRTCLWEGDPEFVIRACQKLAARSKEAKAAVTYFHNNTARMAYDQFRAQGYMIGSGPVESSCKQIVSQRLKRSGAQWHVKGATQTAKARAVWLSRDWESLCQRRDALPLAV